MPAKRYSTKDVNDADACLDGVFVAVYEDLLR
jgi:hypothetical protein